MKTKVPSEALECVRLVDYLRNKNIKFSHIANEASSRTQRIKNARLGTVPGVPDFLLLIPGRDDCCFIEMKRQKGGRVSPEQKLWIDALRAQGQQAFVCAGFEQAKAHIEALLAQESVK